MATNYNYPDPADIEAQAQYRPGAASNIFNVLTGGLAGQITGSTQRGQEAARARQALLQEEFNKRDEQRMLDRQLMINALQSGLDAPVGPDVYAKMADLKSKGIRKTLAAAQGSIEGLKSPTGPYQSLYQYDPAFQISAAQAQADLEKRRVELQQTKDLEVPELVSALSAYGVQASPNMPAGQIRSMLRQAELKAGSQIPAQMRQEDDKTNLIDMYTQYPGLEAFGGRSDTDIQNLPASAAKAILTRANNEVEKTKTLRNKEAQSNAFTRTIGILNLPFEQRTTPENLQALYADSALVGKTITDSPKWQAAMGLGPSLSDKELENVRSYSDSLEIGNNFAKLLADVAKQPGGLKKFQNNNFGTIANAVNSKGSKFFSNDAERELARALVQEYEGFRQVPRKTLFGASLTGTEQESANISFGTPSDKDFFNRAVQFIDRVQQTDPVTFYLNSGKSINDPLVSKVISQKKTYSDYRNAFAPSPLSPQEEARKQELLRKPRRTQ